MSDTMSFRTSLIGLVLAMLALFQIAAGSASAQSPFSVVRKVGDRVITEYDVSQRMTFLELLNSGSADLRAEAITRLTEEAVQRAHARRLGVRITPDELADGMAEFAGRAQLETDAFVAELDTVGIAPESFESFVEAGLLWRKVVGPEISATVTVTATDVARARDVAAIRGTKRVLISEIFLPADPQYAEPVAQIIDRIEAAGSIDEFSALAREFSLAGTRDRGGRLDWVPLEQLPGQIRGPISGASPGQIVGPVELSGAIAFFQLRAVDSTRNIPADRVKLTYKRLLLPGGRSAETMATYADIRARVQHCAGLDPYAEGLPDGYISDQEGLMQSIPQSDAVELARLDRFEISANTVEGDNLVVLMLCARELEQDPRPSDAQIENTLFNARLGARAQLKLDELIADTVIVDY